jgi:hypothetical protein
VLITIQIEKRIEMIRKRLIYLSPWLSQGRRIPASGISWPCCLRSVSVSSESVLLSLSHTFRHLQFTSTFLLQPTICKGTKRRSFVWLPATTLPRCFELSRAELFSIPLLLASRGPPRTLNHKRLLFLPFVLPLQLLLRSNLI